MTLNKEEEMVRGKGRKILTYSERMGLKDQKIEAEAVLKESQTPGLSRGVDQARVKAEIAHLDKVITEGTAPRLTSNSKDKLASEARDLKDRISEGMPTRFEMDHPAKAPGAVQKHLSWDKRNREDIQRFKEIQRSINPDAPVNIESFRRDK